MKQCISQICICGRHRCPHRYSRDIIRPNPVKGKLPISETKAIYRGYPYKTPQGPIKPHGVAWIDDSPMPKSTVTRDDYPPREVPPRQPPFKPQYQPPKGELYASTTYKDNFCKGDRYHPRVESCKPEAAYKLPTEKMESTTTQGHCYIPWDKEDALACRGKLCHMPHTLTVRDQQFFGNTTFHHSYKDPMNPKRELGKAPPCNLHTEGRFQGVPVTKMDYTNRFVLPERMLPRRKRLELPPFKGHSTYHDDFKMPFKISQFSSFAPDREFKPPEKPFEKKTRYKLDYPGWEASPRKDPPWKPGKPYEKPDIPLSGVTSYRTDFLAPPEDLVAEKGKGREPTLCIGEPGPMRTETSHRNDFICYEGAGPAQSCKAAHLYKPPEEKFATDTIFRSHYTGEYGPPAEMITPCSHLATDHGKMEKTTITKRDYQSRHMECPAAILKSKGADSLPQFQYLDTACGHEFYKKFKPPKQGTALGVKV